MNVITVTTLLFDLDLAGMAAVAGVPGTIEPTLMWASWTRLGRHAL